MGSSNGRLLGFERLIGNPGLQFAHKNNPCSEWMEYFISEMLDFAKCPGLIFKIIVQNRVFKMTTPDVPNSRKKQIVLKHPRSWSNSPSLNLSKQPFSFFDINGKMDLEKLL